MKIAQKLTLCLVAVTGALFLVGGYRMVAQNFNAALESAAAVPMPTPEPTPLAKGAKGDGVREVQEALRAYGFMTGSADGDFGKLTDEGLKLFQQYLYVVEGREYYTTPEPTLITALRGQRMEEPRLVKGRVFMALMMAVGMAHMGTPARQSARPPPMAAAAMA